MKKIGEIFDSLSRKNSTFEQLRLRVILSDLKPFLGESLARHCKFLELRDGTLYFECDDQMWLTQANFMRRKLKDRINEVLRDQEIRDVVFRRCKR